MANGWHNASRRSPCPICRKTDWCSMSDDGMMCVCRRVPSDRPSAGGGWIHRLVDAPVRVAPVIRRLPQRRLVNMETVMRGFRAEFEAHRGCDMFDSLLEVSRELRLPAPSLDALGVGRSSHHMAWAFPMRDADGKVVGIRLRRYWSSDKFSVGGSADGLFIDPSMDAMETVANGVRGREIVVVEGPTDTAAGLSLGLACVGRSSCSTGARLLRDLCARLRVSRVTIIADNDRYKERTGGGVWRPGVDGAERLAHDLGRCHRIVVPPCKDLREWVGDGLTREKFDFVANQQNWRLR